MVPPHRKTQLDRAVLFFTKQFTTERYMTRSRLHLLQMGEQRLGDAAVDTVQVVKQFLAADLRGL